MSFLLLTTAILPTFVQHLIEVESRVVGRRMVTGITRIPWNQILINLLQFKFPR